MRLVGRGSGCDTDLPVFREEVARPDPVSLQVAVEGGVHSPRSLTVPGDHPVVRHLGTAPVRDTPKTYPSAFVLARYSTPTPPAGRTHFSVYASRRYFS